MSPRRATPPRRLRLAAAVAAVVLATLGVGCAGGVAAPVAAPVQEPLPLAVRRSRLAPELYTLYSLRMQLGIEDEPLILASP